MAELLGSLGSIFGAPDWSHSPLLWFGAFCVAAILIAIYWWVAVYNPGAQSLWEQLPTREEFFARHADCAPAHPACPHCHNTDLLDVGLLGFSDWRRQMICRGCKRKLWRE